MNCAAHDIGFVQHFLAEQNCWEEESPSGFAGAYGLAAVAAHDFHAAVQARSPVGSAEACSCAESAGTHIPDAAVCVVVVVVVVVVAAAAADNDADEYCSSSPFADDYSSAVAVDHVEGERSLVAAAEPCDALVPAAAAVAVAAAAAAAAVVVVVVVVVVVAVAAVAAVFALIH